MLRRVLPKTADTLLENWPDRYDSLLPPHVLEQRQKSQEYRLEQFSLIENLYNSIQERYALQKLS